jgi:PAS domain S-box-containing protein
LHQAGLLQPDLILLDVQLPGMGGFEICRRLKEQENTRNISVIFMNALAATEYKLKGFEVGGVDYITKPLQVDEIIARVGTHLKLRNAQRQQEVLNAQLELRVAERTAELEERNRQLAEVITQRKQAELVLAAREREFHTLAENAPDNIARHDRQCRFLYINRQYEKSVGMSADEVVGKSPVEHYPGSEDVAAYQARMMSVIETGHPEEFEATLPDAGSGVRYHSIRLAAEYDENGEVVGVLALGRDITERKRMENELLVREQKYRTLVENIPDLIVRYDPDLRRTYVNPAWEAASGLSAGEVIHAPGADILKDINLTTNSVYKAKLLKVLESGIIESMEFTWVNARGETLYLQYVIVPEFDQRGQVVSMLAVGHDITQRKEAKLRLLESEKRLRLTLEACQIGIWDWDIKNDRWFASSTYYTMLGYAPKEGEADRGEWMERLHPDDRAHFVEKMQDVLSRDFDEYSYEARMRHADGTYRWQQVIGFGIERDADGKVARMLGIRMDINERKLTEQQLQMKEFALDQASDAIFLIDANVRFVYVNDAACRSLGYRRDELLGLTPYDIDPDVTMEYSTAIREKTRATDSTSLETRHRRRDGSLFPVEIRCSVFEYQGQMMNMALARDITERKHVETEIHRINQELEQRVAERTSDLAAANKELEAFSDSVSHDLRAPLRHIDGYLGLLRERMAATLDEESLRYMDSVSRAAMRMGLLIDDLFSFSRMGRTELIKKDVNLIALTRKLIREFEPETNGRAIDWCIGDMPVVRGDVAMLRVALINLIANALKFTQRRERAQIEIGRLPSRDTEIVVFVRDNGVGFDMKYSEKLFGVFQRLHGAHEFEGTGIGLANVRRVISRHGGRTWAEGEVDAGATFFFSLPR